MARGGYRPGAGRKPNPNKPKNVAATKLQPRSLPAEPKTEVGPAIDSRAWAMMLPEIEEISRRYAVNKSREHNPHLNPFKMPAFPEAARPKDEKLLMAMDSFAGTNWGAGQWAGAELAGLPAEGLLFLGYPYLSELAQRPEYRVMSETIADDATREWIDFDVTGDEKKMAEQRKKDPEGFDERMADPDERKKRVKAAGKTDKVKALQDDQLRLEVQHRFYEQARNDGFFGRSHLYLEVHTGGQEPGDAELKQPIGDGRDEASKTKVPKNSLKALRTIEPVWTYPLMYNAINPLRLDWYNPQTWYVMGREIDGTRIQTFVGHPVPDMLKPAYAFGGLSLSQMAKPYVDIWLQTRQSVAELIHSFSVMVLMTDLSALMQPNNVGALIARVAMFNMFRDNQGVFALNKNTEDFKNVSASLSGLHELQAQAQEHMASVARIPLVKFTGIQPAGLNASSEGEIKVYDDTISAYQNRFFRPNLTRVVNFEQLSLFGEVDPEITWRFKPLRVMTEAEKGTKQKDEADRNQKYVDMGAFSPGEIRKIAINDPDLPFTDLDPEDVPEPPAEEGLLGPGAGGAAKAFEEGGQGEEDGGGPGDGRHLPAQDAAPARTIQLIRHGATRLNNDDVSVDRIRGWKDVPLSRDGEEQAEKLGRKMRDDPPDVIVSSDLKRAADTARIVSRITGAPLVEVTEDFRPWNVGDYAGVVTMEALPVLADFATNRPGEAIPGGESFDDFSGRFLRGLARVLEANPGRVAVVTHHRGERLLKAWIKAGCPADGEVDKKEFCKKGEPTGAVMDLEVPVDDLRAAAEGGGASDAADPFGAIDGDWREEDHPRAPDGKFGSGGPGKAGKSAEFPGIPDFLKRNKESGKGGKQTLLMPQFGLTPTPWESHQPSAFKLPARKPMPKSSGRPGAPGSVVAFVPGQEHGVKSLNGVPLTPWSPPDDWAAVEGQAEIAEPPAPELPEGMTMSSGVIVREPDGRVWLMRPKGGFGGYDQTFPKGGVEEGLSLQANAIKEAWEETGLKVRITGFAGDHEGDVTVSRFYYAEREGGDPADAGWEAEGVVLAPPEKLGEMLNRKRDLAIAAQIEAKQQKPALDPKGLTKVGGKMGSNEGGTFEDQDGNRYYVKRPPSKEHVRNELTAARLYQLAGVSTLDYRDVKGGNHVATELAQLDKNNVSQLTPEQRREATRDFAVHAWLANHDAAGTGGDNQGVLNGKVTTLDVGGSLRYRAQGAPRGAAFGDHVAEVDSMRDPAKSPDAARLFGKMSDADLKASASRVTSIPDAAIRETVGDDAELADRLIARKRDLAKRFELQAADEAPFEESKHPRDPDGKFTSGAGGGGKAAPSPVKKPEPGKPSAFGGLYKHVAGGSEADDWVTPAKFYLDQPPKAGTHYRNMLKNLIENAKHFGASDLVVGQLKAHLGHAWANAGAGIIAKMKGMTDQAELNAAAKDAEKAYAKAAALGWKPEGGVEAYANKVVPPKPDLGSMAGQKAPPLAPPPAKPKHGPATAAELQKASKTVPLQLQYVPGAPQGDPDAQKLVDAFNKKYANFPPPAQQTKELLQQKVDDFKDLTAAMIPLQSKTEQQKAAAAAEHKAAAQKAAKEAADKLAKQKAAEKEKLAAQHAEVTAQLGITDPNELEAFDSFIDHFGGTANALSKFKAWQSEAEQAAKSNPGHGFEKLSGFEMGCIKAYTGPQSGWINQAIIDDVLTPAQYMFEKVLNQALDKLPKKKAGSITRRGLTLKPQELAKMQPGKIWTHRNFASSSAQGWGGNTKLHITSSGKGGGAYVAPISSHKGEGETLFKSNLRLYIDKVEDVGGVKHVHCREM